MPTKSLRIQIADADWAQALKIEKSLNAAGYFRIAPLYDLQALVSLYDAQVHDFDLLLLSQKMADVAAVDVEAYRQDNQQFRHVLIYPDADCLVPQVEVLMQTLDPSGHT